ncbi:MAG: YihY/virulence factor BrkB family protein [Kurthia sp.]|nr:YihY/virulence factor BrkB family protein [Candidatus Kurthia equi]
MDEQKNRSSEIVERMKLMQVEKKKPKVSAESFDYTKPKGFFKGFLNGVKEADVSSSGAQLAYFFLLSLFPLLLFILTLLPFLNLPQEQVFTMLENVLPAEIYTLIESTIREVLENRNGGLLSIGIIATLWSASNGVNAIVKSLNRSYGIEETRPFIIARGMSLIFTVLFIVLVVVALVLPVFGRAIGEFLADAIGIDDSFLVIFNYIRIILPSVMIIIVLILLYWVVPNRPINFLSAIPGAIFAAVGWGIISFGFSFYINNFANYSKTYGSIGGIIILMLWLYVIGIVLVLGGLLNAAMQRRKEQLSASNSTNQAKV